jgi:hypothetical protein
MNVPPQLREYFNVVKTLKAKEARKDEAKTGALAALLGFLDEEKSILIVTQSGLALCDVNPQAHTQFDRNDSSPEIQGILAAEKAVKAANAQLQAALGAGKVAKKVKVTKENSIRLEILSADKTADMIGKLGPQIRAIRRGRKAAALVA